MRGDAQALWLMAVHRLHHTVTETPKRVAQSPDLCTAIAIGIEPLSTIGYGSPQPLRLCVR